MDGALEKTLMLLLFILVGILIRKKYKNKEQVNGIKNMILTIALPATIFVALMGVEVELSMLIYPLLALIFNLILYFLTPGLLRIFGVDRKSKEGRTLRLLLPSLAPGLSCFPFIIEFLGESELAIAALADVGNKVFVLLFLYIIAMNIFMANNPTSGSNGRNQKLKALLLSLVKEPINLVIITAIVLLAVGIQLDDLPGFLSSAFERMGGMMTPLVLIFIGLAVTVTKKKLVPIFTLLLSRAGLSMIVVGLVCLLVGVSEQNLILLSVAFSLSSCSFWPFAHMASFDQREDDLKQKEKSFDLSYGLLVLAISLPVSTLLILGVLNSGSMLSSPKAILVAGALLMIMSLIPRLVILLKTSFKMTVKPKMQTRLEPAD